jgi:hypothetical protein
MKRILPVLLFQLLFFSACSLTETPPKSETQPKQSVTTQPAPKQTQSAPNKLQTQITPSQLLITQKDYGDKWPFTKEKGILTCKGTKKLGEVVLTVDGVPYAINGTAKRTRENQPLEKIWADNPAIPGTKKNLGDVIDKGLALCR